MQMNQKTPCTYTPGETEKISNPSIQWTLGQILHYYFFNV